MTAAIDGALAQRIIDEAIRTAEQSAAEPRADRPTPPSDMDTMEYCISVVKGVRQVRGQYKVAGTIRMAITKLSDVRLAALLTDDFSIKYIERTADVKITSLEAADGSVVFDLEQPKKVGP